MSKIENATRLTTILELSLVMQLFSLKTSLPKSSEALLTKIALPESHVCVFFVHFRLSENFWKPLFEGMNLHFALNSKEGEETLMDSSNLSSCGQVG